MAALSTLDRDEQRVRAHGTSDLALREDAGIDGAI